MPAMLGCAFVPRNHDAKVKLNKLEQMKSEIKKTYDSSHNSMCANTCNHQLVADKQSHRQRVDVHERSLALSRLLSRKGSLLVQGLL